MALLQLHFDSCVNTENSFSNINNSSIKNDEIYQQNDEVSGEVREISDEMFDSIIDILNKIDAEEEEKKKNEERKKAELQRQTLYNHFGIVPTIYKKQSPQEKEMNINLLRQNVKQLINEIEMFKTKLYTDSADFKHHEQTHIDEWSSKYLLIFSQQHRSKIIRDLMECKICDEQVVLIYNKMFFQSLIPMIWDNCDRCLYKQCRDKHIGTPFYNPQGNPCAHLVPIKVPNPIYIEKKMTMTFDKKYSDNFVRLDKVSSEYTEIAKNFYNEFTDSETKPLVIVGIGRIQNENLFTEYIKGCINETTGNITKDVKLYHTSSASLDELVLEGLDARLSSIGLFGKGIYATSSPAKAASYWKGTSEIRTMFQVRMNLENVYTFPNGIFDHTLVREPRGYDSVKGNMTGQDEYIVYKNSRAYIEYLIEYMVIDEKILPASVRVTVPAATLPPQTQTPVPPQTQTPVPPQNQFPVPPQNHVSPEPQKRKEDEQKTKPTNKKKKPMRKKETNEKKKK